MNNTQNELYLEYARCINMCKGTEVKPWECVLVKLFGSSLYRRENMHLAFDGDPEIYKFAVFLLDGKPVFPGDILYLMRDGNKKYAIYKDGYKLIDDESSGILYDGKGMIKKDWRQRYVSGIELEHVWSWNPPKKQEYVINTTFASSIQKKTPSFALNFAKLPSPVCHGPTVENAVSIRSGGFVGYFGFESRVDADLVALNIIKILETALEERSKP